MSVGYWAVKRISVVPADVSCCPRVPSGGPSRPTNETQPAQPPDAKTDVERIYWVLCRWVTPAKQWTLYVHLRDEVLFSGLLYRLLRSQLGLNTSCIREWRDTSVFFRYSSSEIRTDHAFLSLVITCRQMSVVYKPILKIRSGQVSSCLSCRMCLQGTAQRSTPEFWFGWCYLVVMSLAALANCVLITIFCVKRRYRRSYNLAYLNLAVTDAMAALFGATFRGPGEIFSSFLMTTPMLIFLRVQAIYYRNEFA